MNYPAASNGGITASLGQATGYQTEIIIPPRGGELNPVRLWRTRPPEED